MYCAKTIDHRKFIYLIIYTVAVIAVGHLQKEFFPFLSNENWVVEGVRMWLIWDIIHGMVQATRFLVYIPKNVLQLLIMATSLWQ